jgi:hypothetical protein
MSDLDTFLKSGVVNDVVAALQSWPREHISERELATAITQPVNVVISLFCVLGVVPRNWAFPELYAVEDVLEAATRHEVSQRANP